MCILQGGYSECAELILQCHPKQVGHVIQLVMRETVPEPKMLSLLQYLCNASVDLLVGIVGQLAEHTTIAGQQLLRLAHVVHIKLFYACEKALV